jgi:hypothetical protein
MITPEDNPVNEKMLRRHARQVQTKLKRMFGTDESGEPRAA